MIKATEIGWRGSGRLYFQQTDNKTIVSTQGVNKKSVFTQSGLKTTVFTREAKNRTVLTQVLHY